MIIPSDIALKYPFELRNKKIWRSVIFDFVELSGGQMPLYTLELKTEKDNTEIKIQKHFKKYHAGWMYKTIFEAEVNNPGDLKIIFMLTKVIDS
jgi:hypothetical protein